MDVMIRALSDGNRRRLLEELRSGPATVTELAALIPVARPGVSRHLRVLREAGLVDYQQRGQQRMYRLNAAPLAELDEWLSPYRERWQSRLDALHTEVVRSKQTRRTPNE